MLIKEDSELYSGHRHRLRERFITSGFGSLADYEILELLLFLAKPRGDVKPLAKKLIANFGSLQRIFSASEENLSEIEGVGKSIISSLKLVKESAARMLKEEIKKTTIIQSWSALIEYLKVSMAYIKTEQFRVLFLNKKNMLIADELQEVGTVDQTPVYPREIVKRALFHEATAIILVHNHPSGNSNPSNADIQMTKKIISALSSVGVDVHDHIIICDKDFYSFKSNMLI
jgi:DNA repair protein RadC